VDGRVVASDVVHGAVVEALRYIPEGRGIDSRWCYWNLFIDIFLALGSTQPPTRNEYQEYFLGVKAVGV
jgi:hypothetical protein